MAVVTLAELLEAGVHFGHQARRWNPKMFPYIYAERNGIHIIDLVQTSQLLTNACEFVRKSSQEGKKFLLLVLNVKLRVLFVKKLNDVVRTMSTKDG